MLTPDEKRAYRLNRFLESGKNIPFVNQEAERNYTQRVKRFVDVMNVEKPDRVPVNAWAGNLPLAMAGLETRTAYYEPAKACEASVKFNEQHAADLESFSLPFAVSGEAMDILDYRLYAWPGHGIPDNAGGWQFIEGEYMTTDEYDDLIRDPSDFWLRKYLPRAMGSFRGFSLFQPFTNITESLHVNNLEVLSTPEVQDMLKTLLKAGEAFGKYRSAMAPYAGMAPKGGYPYMASLPCFAPFDTLGDTLRGTTNIMKDMFRRPEKLLAALDVIADLTISNILTHPRIDQQVIIRYPLHKGADGWMSQKQFEKFYWPSLKKVMDAFIEEGLIQQLFAEGGYNTRIEYCNQFAKGTVTWLFDQTDMALAKKVLGKECCLQGNVPSSLLVTSGPDQVKAYCRNLIEVAGKDGGFILSPGAQTEYPKLENLKAMVQAAREYGVY